MLGIFKYSHLSTKIRAMYGKMLKDEDYETIIQMHSVKEVAIYLKNNTYYSQALEDLDENNVHRGHLEILLYRAEITDALKITKYLHDKDKKMFRYVYRRQEIEDLKKMLRHLQMGKSLEEIDRQSLFISWYSVLNFNETLKAKTVSELLETIKGTNFYGILKPLQISETKIDIFAAEMALDLYYYTSVKKLLKKSFKGKDREVAYILFGMEADIKNIIWIYRGKLFYAMNKQLLYRYLIPLKYKLTKEIVDQMIQIDNPKDIKSIIDKSYYGKILSDDIKNWENDFLVYLHETMLRSMRQYAYTVSPVMSYILIKEVEKYNITSIVEGIRYDIEPDLIREQVIGLNSERR